LKRLVSHTATGAIAGLTSLAYALNSVQRTYALRYSEQIPGFEIIRDEASDLLLLLEPYYQSFIDLIDFKDLAVKTMNEVVMEIAELKVRQEQLTLSNPVSFMLTLVSPLA
jgi:hypothetical protein